MSINMRVKEERIQSMMKGVRIDFHNLIGSLIKLNRALNENGEVTSRSLEFVKLEEDLRTIRQTHHTLLEPSFNTIGSNPSDQH